MINPINDSHHISERLEDIQEENKRLDMREILTKLQHLYLKLYPLDNFFGEFCFDESEEAPFLVLMDKIVVEVITDGFHVSIGEARMRTNEAAITMMVKGTINFYYKAPTSRAA